MYRLRKKTTFVKNKTFVLIFVDDRAYKGHMYIDCPRAGHCTPHDSNSSPT